MEIIRDMRGTVADGVQTAISIGAYDGIHLGHQSVISTLRDRAEANDLATAVITFDQHPALVLRPENAPKLLTTLDQRLELIEALGVDYVYLIEFTPERSKTSPEQFVEYVFVKALHARMVVVGENFHFGRGRAGDVAALEQLGEAHGFDVEGVPLLQSATHSFEPVSSTGIRRALAGGHVAEAAAMLGRNYEVRGDVIHGDARGHAIGFPTANIPVDRKMAWPADGVYAGWFTCEGGDRHPCAINIGRRPTFHLHAEHSLLEAHLLDFEGDLYGQCGRVEFVQFLRSEQRFNGIDALAEQLKKDVEHTREVLARE